MTPQKRLTASFEGRTRKRILSFLLGILLIFSNPFPTYSQSVMGCAESPACLADIAGTRAALSVPSASTPFAIPVSKAAVAAGGAAVALAYLTAQDMQKLRDRAQNEAPLQYPSGSQVARYISPGNIDAPGWSCGLPCSGGEVVTYNNGTTFAPRGVLASPQYYFIYNADPLAPSLPDAVNALSPDAILAAAVAAAAAATTAAANNNDSNAAAIAAAAAAAALSFMNPSSPDYAAASAAASAAATAAAATAASNAAKDQAKQDAKALYPDFPQAQDKIAPATGYSSSVNWLTYGIAAFSNKFPFDIFSMPTGDTSNECPTYTFFNRPFELCPLRDLVGFLKIPVIISFLIWSAMTI